MRAIPEQIRLSVRPPPPEGVALELTSRRIWRLGLFFGAFFVVFAWIALSQLRGMGFSSVEDVFDLVVVLFQAFWLLGWSVGVVFLLAMTVLLLFYDESARLTARHLIYAPRLGPLHVLMAYDLSAIGHPRLEEATGGSGDVRIRFDYRGDTVSLGNDMPRSSAQSAVSAIERAVAAASVAGGIGGAPRLPGKDVTGWLRRSVAKRVGREASPDRGSAGSDRAGEPEGSVRPVAPGRPTPPGWGSASVLALLLANLVPLVGVVGFGWDLGEIMMLFWAESGIIGFYAILRLCRVAGWSALFLGPFFVAHFGGFMAGHFLFIYTLFIQGIEADGTIAAGADTGVLDTLGGIFGPLYPAVLALFLSHGVSFVTNFLRRREYAGRDASDQMKEPYKRIMVMHVTIIFGGWLILGLGTPVWALVLLVGLKTTVDLTAHRKEHGGR